MLDQLLHVGHTTGDDACIDGHSGLLAVSRLSRLGLRLSQFSDSRGTTRRNTQPEDPLAQKAEDSPGTAKLRNREKSHYTLTD